MPVAGIFPPQREAWGLSEDCPLSPLAARRVAREAATQSFENGARALNEDWGTQLDGKHIQRWAQRMGQKLIALREAELKAGEAGRPPRGPLNDPELLVVGMDGGRVQSREKNEKTGSRWREDKVLTITSYRCGKPGLKDGEKEGRPTPLVSTYLATMGNSNVFGELVRLESERRGVRQARRVLVLGDGGEWIDTIHLLLFARHIRIVDYYHALEHLCEVARVLFPQDMARQKRLAGMLEDWLWKGKIEEVIRQLRELAQGLGPVEETDGPDHPRRVLSQNVGYFEKHMEHMRYAEYRKRGWPIGSGTVESGVKLFNKRVKGTEQFWHEEGVEPILALRAMWLSQDQRWQRYWTPNSEVTRLAA